METALYDNEDDLVANPPAHPVAQLQGPFEESMIESVNDLDNETSLDSFERRTMLLEKPKYERVIAGRWKQKPGEKYHPLWKITAQLSFGMHLLAEGMARSEEEVMKILQSHVDDIDGFLERTTEDFELAQSDVKERLRYLKLPLEHVEVFDRMLEDRTFRMSIVEGNEKIEHIVDRTSEAMKDSLKDVLKGLEATKALDKYLADLDTTWIRSTAEHDAVFVAMQGNVEGWSQALMDLYLEGHRLGKSLVQLSEIVIEMQRRAGVVSRRMLIRPTSTTSSTRHSQQSRQSQYPYRPDELGNSSRPTSTAPLKPLPVAPENRLSTQRSSKPTLPRQSASTEKQAMFYSRPSSSQNQVDKRGSSNNSSAPASQSSKTPSPSTKRMQQPIISELAGTDAPIRVKQPTQTPLPVQPRVRNMTPMELPAEVPVQILSQAPHSNKSRLSTVLTLKARDQNEKRSSQFMTAKSLGSLLKTPLPTRASLVLGSKDTLGPQNSPTVAEQNPGGAIALQRSNTLENRAPIVRSLEQVNQGLGIQSFPQISNSVLRPRRENLAFTSHPPEMMLGAKPVLPGHGSVKPAELPSEGPAHATYVGEHSRQPSHLSSLGEPGPEIDIEAPKEELQPLPVPETTKGPQPSTLLDAIAKRTLLSEGQPPLGAQTRPSGLDAPRPQNELTLPGPRFAEMEGSSPILLAPLTFGGPVELEAPLQRLVLPPRPSKQNPDTQTPAAQTLAAKTADELSATITTQSDFFKLPALQTAEGTSRPVSRMTDQQAAPSQSSTPTTSSLNQGVSRSEERSSLPLRLTGSRITRKDVSESARHRSNLLEHISYTPPESPIHARSMSEASANSARIMIERPTRSLAPPHEAPPPPAPGGRSMVNPNYAAAGAFEGERRSKHGSSGSIGSWKKLISVGATPLLTPSVSRPGSSSVSGRPSLDAKNSGVNMMTAGGNDVLWFKGMSKDGVWMSSS